MQNNYLTIETALNYRFKNRKNLIIALTHPSYANENHIERWCTNQRLEFLGDSVLELVSSDYLYNYFPQYEEGNLTKLRSILVCEESLADIARELKLYEYLRLGKGENKDRVKDNNSIMCDTLEAIIGAIYVDDGIFQAQNFIKNFILTDKNLSKNSNDYKSIFQELANSKGAIVKYDLLYEKGPDHLKQFCINVFLNDDLLGNGCGKSKKEAEQNAAKAALIKLSKDCKCS